ncbi:hypothetical protein [Nitrosopumilus ureiphilus]|uniref:Roadblock/LAMTOR2 domain-containing protein n=1 Tax=Nitrosopumilus ureiphilus TaxID=1470067 RepID=A0A7D5R8D5_9ARCH|nr:hypothetical protein [Nitrosopumilus ureiphilus]QLH07459.1 hypothetical protein C5F50_10550 [Nitrosopumilus ureiphilus]
MSVIVSEESGILSREIMSSEIEFICLINTRGRLVDSLGIDCIDMPQSSREMFFMKIALRNSMQRDFDDYLGHVDYCMTQRGNKKFITIPLSDKNTILAVIDKESNQNNVILNIIEMVRRNEQDLDKNILEVKS